MEADGLGRPSDDESDLLGGLADRGPIQALDLSFREPAILAWSERRQERKTLRQCAAKELANHEKPVTERSVPVIGIIIWPIEGNARKSATRQMNRDSFAEGNSGRIPCSSRAHSAGPNLPFLLSIDEYPAARARRRERV